MAAETLDDAKRAYLEQVGGPEEEMLDDPGEIAESQYDKLMFCDEDGMRRTFREQLNRMIERGGERFPTFFASREW